MASSSPADLAASNTMDVLAASGTADPSAVAIGVEVERLSRSEAVAIDVEVERLSTSEEDLSVMVIQAAIRHRHMTKVKACLHKPQDSPDPEGRAEVRLCPWPTAPGKSVVRASACVQRISTSNSFHCLPGAPAGPQGRFHARIFRRGRWHRQGSSVADFANGGGARTSAAGWLLRRAEGA